MAGTASCTAVQGGLLAGLTSADRSARPGPHGGTEPSNPLLVALFLAGRAGSHIVAGLLLGLVGSAVQPGPQVRAALLVTAGIAVVFFGIRAFGREPDGREGCHPAERRDNGQAPDGHECGPGRNRDDNGPGPDSEGRGPFLEPGHDTSAGGASTGGAPDGGASDGRPPRRGALFRLTAPAPRAVALGAATVLLPCGVTLSAEMVAVSSGSALGGAAVMAGFVAGTAPAFALLGLLLRRAAGTRLAALAGVVALAAGLWTVSSGLQLGGWLPGSGGQGMAAGGQAPAANRLARPGSPAGVTAAAGGVQRIEIWATTGGYRPGVVTARAGLPTELVFHLAGTPGCTRTLTIDGRDVALPATVRLGARGTGSLRYVCSMGMYPGFVNFV